MPKYLNSMGTQAIMRESILLVEDEQALQMVVGDRLRKDGYLVDSASDGETGFRKATSQPLTLRGGAWHAWCTPTPSQSLLLGGPPTKLAWTTGLGPPGTACVRGRGQTR
jgi:hypothetical protein